METLAFIHTAVAYEDPNPESELRSFEDLNLKAPGSIALGVLSAGVVTATLSHADQAQALIVRGNTGSGVARLQEQLGIRADGVFGSQTRSSVVSFQRRNNLLVDGKAGPQTLSALGLPPYLGPGNSTSPGNELPTAGTAYVTAGIGVNVRSSPWGSVVGGLPYGARVSLTGNTRGGWSQLTSGNWVASQYISYRGGGVVTPIPTGPYVAAGIGLKVRNAPAGYVIGGLGYGAPLSLTGAEQFAAGRSWSQLSSGGWVASEYIGFR